jgi:cobalt-zinc-cadmium efflux system protein
MPRHGHADHGHADHGRADHGRAGHGHAEHGHAGHQHTQLRDPDARYLVIAASLITCFLLAEVAVGIAAHSLALISDAAHMLTDVGALVFSLVALRLAARPASGRLTYGWKRMEIFSAQTNGMTLVLLAAALAVEAVRRLVRPPDVAGTAVLVTALAGVAVNLAATIVLGRADRRGLNIQGAFAHLVSDLYAFAATAAAGLVIIVTGFRRADAVATLVVATVMATSGGRLVRDSARVFLEAAPRGLEPGEIGAAMADRPDVAEVHDLHVWEVTSGLPALSAHVLVRDDGDCHGVADDLRALLRERWSLEHATLQVDHVPPAVWALGARSDAERPRAGQPHPEGHHHPEGHPPRDGRPHPEGDRHPEGHHPDRPSPPWYRGAPPGGHCADPHGPVHRPRVAPEPISHRTGQPPG